MKDNSDKPITKEYCCPAFLEAVEKYWFFDGTDTVINKFPDGTFSIHLSLPPIAFCPWCGSCCIGNKKKS